MVCLFGDRMTVIHGGSNIPHPFSISLFEGQLFFTDWTKMAVLKANKFKETNPRLYYRSSLRPFGVTVYHALRQPDGRRPPTVEKPCLVQTLVERFSQSSHEIWVVFSNV